MSQGCDGCGREFFRLPTAHQTRTPIEIANDAIRTYRRIGCVPGRNNNAGMAVWLMMKNSASPHSGSEPLDRGRGICRDAFVNGDQISREAIRMEAPAGRRA